MYYRKGTIVRLVDDSSITRRAIGRVFKNSIGRVIGTQGFINGVPIPDYTRDAGSCNILVKFAGKSGYVAVPEEHLVEV